MDVIFRTCDFSGSLLEGGYLSRCEFHACKNVGGSLYRAFLQDVLFSGCNFGYANCNSSKWKNVSIADSSFSNADFGECSLKNLELSNVELVRVNFSHTPLAGIDFTASEIADILASAWELRGAVVSPVQAAELAKLLGVVVV